MTEEAIQDKDVSEESETPKEPVKSRRDLAYEAIVESREAEKTAAPAAEVSEEDGGDYTPPAETPVVEPTMIEFMVNGEVVKVPADAKYRAKINGVDVEQTVENITRSYQKGVAADSRLEEATQKARDAEDKALQLAAKETALTAKEKAFVEKMEAAQKAVDDGDLSEDDFQETAKAFIDSLAGDDEKEMVSKVAKVFAGIQKKNKPVTIDEDALLTKAEERAFQRLEDREAQKSRDSQIAEQASANAWFKTEYKDIAEDPRLMGAAKGEAGIVMAENPGLSQRDVAKQVGDRIRAWSGNGKQQPKPPKTPQAAGVRAPVGKDKPPQGRREIFNEMKAARGQPAL